VKNHPSRAAILDDLDVGVGNGFEPASPFRLHISVIHTSEAGTRAALAAAARLAKNLCAQIRLVAAEAVPIHFSLERPHVPAEFMEHRLSRLACDAGIDEEELTVQVSLCRSPKQALSSLLAPRSLLVIGDATRWWNWRERRMAAWLREVGHQVLTVNAAEGKRPSPRMDRGRQAAFYRSLDLVELTDRR
jgi:hypothetical protein